MSSAPVQPLPDGRCPLCGARNRDDAQWCVQCLTRFGAPAPEPDVPEPDVPEPDVPEPDDGRSGSRRGATPAAGDALTGVLPRPRQDRDDAPAGDGSDETANRLLAQLRAHEAQRPWGGPMARRLGLAGPPWLRAAVGAVAVLVVLLVAMVVLGHFVQP